MTIHPFYTKDHPEANGRKAQKGEVSYNFTFPLQDGSSLIVYCGKETLDKFAEFLGCMILDDQMESK